MGSGRAGWPDAVPNFDGPVVSRRQVFACLFFPFLFRLWSFSPVFLGLVSLSLSVGDKDPRVSPGEIRSLSPI